jgi:hypothetical protein
MSTYTTVEAIARRLQGRLKVISTLSPTTTPNYNTQQVVDPLLIQDVLEQVENDLDLTLAQIYEMPLQNKHPLLAGIVEKLVTVEILQTYYQSTQSPEMGGDPGYGRLLYQQAQQAIAKLTAGHNIMVFGVQPPAQMPGVVTPQPIVLPGERLALKPPDTLSTNVTVVTSTKWRKLSDGDRKDWGINWDNQDRARGADELWN